MTAVAVPPRSVSRAVAMALLCHGVFGVAVGSMAVSLATGMRHGLGPLSGASAWLANALLVAQFPLVHSWLLGRGRGWLAKLSPFGHGATQGVLTSQMGYRLFLRALGLAGEGISNR